MAKRKYKKKSTKRPASTNILGMKKKRGGKIMGHKLTH